jgi:hypothetical protein
VRQEARIGAADGAPQEALTPGGLRD